MKKTIIILFSIVAVVGAFVLYHIAHGVAHQRAKGPA